MKRSILIAVAIGLIATFAFAQTQPAPGNGARRVAMLAKYLELTPDQIAATKQIYTETAAAVKPLAQGVATQQKDLQALLKTDAPDPTAVGKLVLSVHATRAHIRQLRQDGRAKFVALLTPDQKTKLEDFEQAAKIFRNGRRARGR